MGYLTKINEGYIFNQYHEKLVVLTEIGLLCFDTPTLPPKKLVPIIGSNINELKEKSNDKEFVFEIKTSNSYRIILCADNKDDYDDWIKVLNEAKKGNNKEKEKIMNEI